VAIEANYATELRWAALLNGDPLPWLLAEDTPAVRHLALRQLLDRAEEDPEVCEARVAAMRSDPIAALLAAQDPQGFWVQPGPGYGPKYRGTVWQLIFLDQLGADGGDPRVHRACAYVLAHTQAATGGFAASRKITEAPPGAGAAIHCLHGNLLRALLGFGWIDDQQVQRAIDWQVQAITGEGSPRYYRGATSGPGFRCGYNEQLPCAWGAVKALSGLARLPRERRTPQAVRAIEHGVELLRSCEPSTAQYPMGRSNTVPSAAWFRLGFPAGYVADVLETLEVLCELGLGGDPRMQPGIAWLLGKQNMQGRWANEHRYAGKMWVDVDRKEQPSKWVTLRACRVLKVASGHNLANHP
jgi:hypothetical protein